MLGLKFENCNAFGLLVKFHGCTLDHSSFYETKMNQTVFSSCQLHGVDFTEAELKDTNFSNSDLRDAIFDGTNLENSDFRNTSNFTLDPERNNLKKSKFLRGDLAGLLSKYKIEIE